MGQGSGIVTPEAVRLDYESAGAGSRTAAILIDVLVQAVLALLLVFGAGLLAAQAPIGLPDWLGITLVLVLLFALVWGYPVAFETLWRGRTPGKAALGLRVVTIEGGPERFRHAAIRATLGIVDFHLTAGGVAVLSTLLTERSQRLGDLVAGTLVLRERTGAGSPRVVRFTVPQGAEAYAASIDPAGMTPADYATVRQLLLRTDELAPAVRGRLAQQIAAPLAARLGHTPPAGVSPEQFLRCVAARYQQRAEAGRTAAGAGAVAPVAAPEGTSRSSDPAPAAAPVRSRVHAAPPATGPSEAEQPDAGPGGFAPPT